MYQETPARPRRLARIRAARSGAKRNSQLRIVSWGLCQISGPGCFTANRHQRAPSLRCSHLRDQ